MDKHSKEYINNKNYILITQKAIILNDKNQILLLRRSNRCKNAGKWNLPGGGLEKEDPTNGIIREIKEETGLDITSIKPIFTISFAEESEFVVMIGYLTKTRYKNITLNWENDQYEWVSKEEVLSSDLSEIIKSFVKQAKI